MKPDHFIKLAPAIVMVLVGLWQVYVTHSDGLSAPDKGGGFGLFSTVDILNNRVVRLYGQFGERESRIRIDRKDALFAELKPLMQEARAYPKPDRLHAVLEQLRKWKFSRRPERVRVEVYKTVFEKDSWKLSFSKLAEAEMRL